jgi:hypothetical protein
VAETINWEAKEAYATRLTNLELLHAIEDCRVAAATVPENAIGKDAAYYRDEGAIYQQEWQRRITIGALTDDKIRELWRCLAGDKPLYMPNCPVCGQAVHQ